MNGVPAGLEEKEGIQEIEHRNKLGQADRQIFLIAIAIAITGLTPQDVRKLIERFTTDQLLGILQDAAARHLDVLNAVRSIADQDLTQRKLFIRGLGWDTTTDGLRTLFSAYGDLDPLGGPYGGYGGPGSTGYGGLTGAGGGGLSGSGVGSSLYSRMPPSSVGMPAGGYPEGARYNSTFPGQHHQGTGASPLPRVPPGGLYPNAPHY